MLESHAGKEYSRAGSLSREQEAIQFASSEPAIRSTSAQSPWPLALVPSFTLDRCGSDSHVRSTAKRGSRQFHSALGRSAAIQESSSTMPTVPPLIIDCDGWSAVAASTQSLTNNPTGIVIHHMANANSNDFSFALILSDETMMPTVSKTKDFTQPRRHHFDSGTALWLCAHTFATSTD